MNLDEIYHVSNSSHSYTGYGFDQAELGEYVQKRVAPQVYDDEGTEEVVDFLSSLTATGFESEPLKQQFDLRESLYPEFWRVGEALSECILEEFRGHSFYVRQIRDAKNPQSSMQGADIVGFHSNASKTMFVFGEIKSSDDFSSPPQVMYGRSGMVKQLEDLCGGSKKKINLVRYLVFKVKNLADDDPLKKDFIEAFKTYTRDKDDVILCGVLVRSTDANESDLRPRYQSLLSKVAQSTTLDLIALYIPFTFDELVKLVKN